MYTKYISGLKLEHDLASFAAATRTLKICTGSSTETNELIFFAF